MTMAFRPRSDGLHHAASLGNIDAAPSQTAFNYAARNYDSEDENMGRLKSRQQGLYNIKPPVYSKEDIIDQYCLTDRQLNNSIEAPRRDRFFGCWSTRSQQSFLGVCVGRRAPSDENLQDYAPINRHPRYQKPMSYDDEDIENSYFRRKPTSFLSSNDPKRHTWMTSASDDDTVRMEGPRPMRNFIDSNGGPYVVGGAYPQKSSFLSQSTEQITGYRCPAHINLPSNATPSALNQNQQELQPRTKHVSFARSLTLASFDDAMGMRQNRLINARSQERLIGGKKSTLTITHQPSHHLQQIPMMQVQTIPILQKPQLQQTFSQPHIGGQPLPILPTIQQSSTMEQVLEKQKRNVMKTQATQTEVFLGRKVPATQTLSLSPRTVHRVKMVSQGAQTNGMNGNKKLTKSYSEMGTGAVDVSCQYEEDRSLHDHESLHRTQSEDSPKSPKDMSYIRPLSGYMMTTAEIHSRTSSRQSQLEMPVDNFYSKPTMHDSCSQDNFMISTRRGSHSLANEPIFIGRNELEQLRRQHGNAAINPYEFETHSLPRRTCIHHQQEEQYHTHSLPRREHHHHYLEHTANTNNAAVEQILEKRRLSSSTVAVSANVIGQDSSPQPSYVNVNSVADTYSLSRRSSSASHQHHQQQQQVPSLAITMASQQQPHQSSSHQKHHQALQQVPPNDEMCSTCSSETQTESETENDEDNNSGSEEKEEGSEEEELGSEEEEEGSEEEGEEEEEKEIFIDFKPNISPTQPKADLTANAAPTSVKKSKKLIKAMSEGEILLENNEKDKQKPTSASEDDLQLQQQQQHLQQKAYAENLYYNNSPIRDEDIFKALSSSNAAAAADHTNTTTSSSSTLNRYCRETFRKRSVSLEDPLADDGEIVKKASKNLKADGSSPGSTCASTDDVTRDHSEGNWNDSQITVLPLPPLPIIPPDGNLLLTPSTKRKHLQHQQRSSLDVEALDIEDIADQPLPPLPPLASSSLLPPSFALEVQPSNNNTVSTTTQTTCLSTIKPSTMTSTPTGIVKPTPSIAVTHTQSVEREEKKINLSQHVKLPSHGGGGGGKRKDIKKHSQHKSKHSALDRVHRSNESLESSGAKTSTESILKRTEGIDASEGSTTEDYITCTDNSKRMSMPPQSHHVPGIRFATATSKGISNFTASHLPGAIQSSQTITVDGSSFESASSFHSLARVDAICEDLTTLPPPTLDEKVKKSPTHSDSSTSSGSYRMPPMKASSPSRPQPLISKPLIHTHVKKCKKASVSDDERSEKFQSSSHDEKDYKTLRRKPRDWNEEERRRKKGNFKLEFEGKESASTLASPFIRPTSTGAIKKISPDDKAALNTLDGTSPSKQKPRFRGKTRKTPRNRTPIASDETARRLSKASINIKSPEKPSVIAAPMPQSTKPTGTAHKVSPTKKSISLPKPCIFASPSKHIKKTSAQRLKAISTESLRSVSPGSDSVFYSEADILEHQIHCHHCGKEVEVVTAVGGSEESVVIVDDGPDIVQPPEGFADSPSGVSKIPPALKYYKRFRSEDRRHKKGSNGRAKSEERNTEDLNGKMRGTGSSPCVVPIGPFAHDHNHEPEQGVYHGAYSQGVWICINDKNFWRKNEILPEVRFADGAASERRGSTDSEKDFRKKYQALTHRLVHRKSCVEMYRRQSTNSFGTDKRVIVQRLSGEFGFRIHGSRPVVVSAIEKDAPAETSGLEVGDIVLSVNSVSVVEKSHSEVVKIAHAGSDTLELEVASTIDALSPVGEPTQPALYSGYLWRKSGNNETVKWIRRWFSLRSDQCVYCYKTETDTQPLGIVSLTNHLVLPLPIEKSSRPYSFSIESTESKTLVLSADSQEIANGWIAIMSHASEKHDPWLETSTRSLKLPPSSIIRPDCTGYLMKLGIRWRSWTKRYCVLKDACLYFYSETNSKNAIGMVCLQGYRVQPFATGVKKYAFELIPSDPKYRNYYFHTENEMEKKRWVAALEYSIDRWMKA